jgi:hypothetical protein
MDNQMMKGFVSAIEKIAFGVVEQNQPQQQHKSLGAQWGTIARHPVGFVSSAVKGEAAGLAGGAIGGALVAAPVAALMAKKHPEQAMEVGKGIFGGIGKTAPTFAGRFAHNAYELGKGETVGGGVLGLGLGANKFFNKYKNENQSNA